MKDLLKPCHHTLSEDFDYKEVVVIGNGPSGLVTSFMLAGNVPHLKQVPDDLPIDDMLRARLSNLPVGVSLYEVDLTELAEGLEGRSQNPMPILMDTLLRPCADLGIQADPLIEWKYDIEKEIDHIVLGRGPPGGSWHNFPPDLRALSPSPWLALPPLVSDGDTSHRMTAKQMADYCLKYVAQCRLQRYFRSGVVVNSVTRLTPSVACHTRNCPLRARFCVCGFDKSTGALLRYYCSRVVVSCGGADRHNTLPLAMPASITQLQSVQDTVSRLPEKSSSILVVGSGVSAADAVRVSMSSGLCIYHVHRAPAPALAKLNRTMYPDYYEVHKMMTNGPSDYTDYTSLLDHILLEVTENTETLKKNVKLLNLNTNQVIQINVDVIAVLIGSKPDLHFLQNNFNMNYLICKCEKEDRCFFRNHWLYLKCFIDKGIQSCKARLNSEPEKEFPFNPYSDGIGFGIDEKKPVDCRSNPLAIDKGSHEMLHAPKGMHALGPVTADNFVRFIPGGALAIVSHMHKEKKSIE